MIFFVSDPTCAKVGANCKSVHRRLPCKWVKYNDNIFIYIHFNSNSRMGQTRQQIVTHEASNDADSCKGVPFGTLVDIAHLSGGQTSKTHFGAWTGVLSQTSQFLYYQNYCIDFNQIFHSHKDHHANTLCGWSKHTNNKPRGRRLPILKTVKLP